MDSVDADPGGIQYHALAASVQQQQLVTFLSLCNTAMRVTPLRLSEQVPRIWRKTVDLRFDEAGPLMEQVRSLVSLKKLSDRDAEIADVVACARKFDMSIPPFSQVYDISSDQAYDIAAELCRRRCRPANSRDRGLFPVGRKIGFTNRNIWPEYNVHGPNWGFMFNKSVILTKPRDETLQPFRMIKSNFEPKIEPEIIFGIAKTPSPSMNDLELLDCISYIGHGFEIVHSIYPGWKFNGSDTTIAGALHSHLLLDPRSLRHLSVFSSPTELLSSLANFEVDLFRNGQLRETGRGSNVLGSPIKALRFLVELLSEQKHHPQLQPDEIVTTGTLTSALAISDGDEWHTEIRGIDLPGHRARFEIVPRREDREDRYWAESSRRKVAKYIDFVNNSVRKDTEARPSLNSKP